MTLSLRERIMEHLKDRFLALQDGTDGYTVTWNTVVRRPMTMTELRLGNALGIYDVDETKSPEIGFYRCNMRVICEFFYLMFEGDEAGTELNRMLTDIQRGMRKDITCGGISINITELRNEIDIEGPAESLVAGIVEFNIQYRHRLDDPREL